MTPSIALTDLIMCVIRHAILWKREGWNKTVCKGENRMIFSRNKRHILSKRTNRFTYEKSTDKYPQNGSKLVRSSSAFVIIMQGRSGSTDTWSSFSSTPAIPPLPRHSRLNQSLLRLLNYFRISSCIYILSLYVQRALKNCFC